MQDVQIDLFGETLVSDDEYVKSQLITYIGNKRSLLPLIDKGIRFAKDKLGQDRISFLDLFAGTGVVSRMARSCASEIHVNDLELYSYVTNSCYQTNKSGVDFALLNSEFDKLNASISRNLSSGFITDLYSPKDDNNIKAGERVFYTRRNAMFLDTFCHYINDVEESLRGFFIAPVLSQASMYANTSGVFKGFYKNKQGIGQFGGTGANALTRILKDINLSLPILSNYECLSKVYQMDANEAVKSISHVDLAYFDPPYNQHPYGSNYFMLNLICKYERPQDISNVSGIPNDWNRSLYNKARFAEQALFDAVENVDAKIVLISYNSEGFISHERFLSELVSLGEVSVMDAKYNTFRGCRNLSNRDIHVTEFLYLVDKR
jgi:adenine-specific DNA-methyltransferase